MRISRRTWSLLAELVVSALLVVAASARADAITFSGSVATSAGEPLAGVTVEMVGNPAISTTSADNGAFSLAGLPSGTTFSVKFSDAGYAASYTHNFNMTTNFGGGAPYALYTAEETSSWGVSPDKGAIRTRVTDSTSGTLAGAVVTATSAFHPGTPYRVVYTDLGGKTGGSSTFANGIFTVLNLDDGDTVTVTAAKAGRNFPARTFVAHADGVNQGRLSGNSVAAADFPLAATAAREMAIGNVAAFDGANYLVGMQGYVDNPSLVTAQRMSPGGDLVGDRISVGWNGGTPQVAFDGANYLMVFDGCPGNSSCSGSGYVISGQFVSKAGAVVGTPFQISQTEGHATWGAFRTVIFDGTNYFVVWDAAPAPETCTDEYGQFVSPSGALLGASIKLNATPCGGGGVTLGFDGAKILAAWVSEWDTLSTRSCCYPSGS